MGWHWKHHMNYINQTIPYSLQSSLLFWLYFDMPKGFCTWKTPYKPSCSRFFSFRAYLRPKVGRFPICSGFVCSLADIFLFRVSYDIIAPTRRLSFCVCSCWTCAKTFSFLPCEPPKGPILKFLQTCPDWFLRQPKASKHLFLYQINCLYHWKALKSSLGNLFVMSKATLSLPRVILNI